MMAAIVAAGLGASPAGAASGAIVDVRAGALDDNTRIVLELTHKIEFSVFTLGDPDRVVVDLPEVAWRPGKALPASIGVLDKLRYGVFKPGQSRIVIDLARPARILSAVGVEGDGAHGFRVMIDLGPATREAMLMQAQRPVTGALAPAPPELPKLQQPEAKLQQAEARLPQAEAKIVPAAAPAMVPFDLPRRKPIRQSKRVIVLDPGHGGVDPGTAGPTGIVEKHLTLSVARAVRERLEATGLFRVVMTRDRDVFIPLRDRLAIAKDAGAHLFVSLHADATDNRRTRGASVYTLSEKASDQEAEAFAEKENKADLIGGVDLSQELPEVTNILIDLAQREAMNQSALFATRLVNEMGREARLLRNTHRFAGFAVLRSPDTPAVLVEIGFLSNPEDEALLNRESHRSRIANAVVRSIEGYFATTEEAKRP